MRRQHYRLEAMDSSSEASPTGMQDVMFGRFRVSPNAAARVPFGARAELRRESRRLPLNSVAII
ncbi:MAG: hypothetical protein VYA84_03380 [Planctomycetota bacterium]|nr:hypothetical protein [Planctomycetota bacterium]